MKKPTNISLFLISFMAIASISGIASAQDKKKPAFNVKKFLSRLDTNQNGKVEPSEIPDDRTRGFLEKAGVDPSKPISISNFSKEIEKKRDDRNKPGSSQQSLGFAVDNGDREESGNTQGFSVSDEERAPVERARTQQFSAGAKKMLDWVLSNYDKNKDGKLDKNEIKSGRWSDPPASDSDTNKDGSLSRTELLIRYEKREDEKEKKEKGRTERRDRSRREQSSSRDTKSKGSTSGSKSGASTGKRDVRKGYESYVDGLFKTYDKDKNGSLDSKEIEGMRRKPDMAADKDEDKKISKSELLESYLEKSGQGGSKKGGDSSKKRSDSKSASNSIPSSSNLKVRPPLTDKDKNRNGQIEMSEYADTWTVETVKEFYEKDKNKDGVITSAEWNAK